MAPTKPSTRDDFQIAIICAIETEYDAACLIFDEFWDVNGDVFGKAPEDPNHYATGRVGSHNVVLARLYEEAEAGAATTGLCLSYRKLRLALVVGVSGAVPTSQDGEEIILGDVIISDMIVEYDFEEEPPHRFKGKNTISDRLPRRNRELRNLVGTLRTPRGIEMMDMAVCEAFRNMETKDKEGGGDCFIVYPGAAYDRLYQPTHPHIHRDAPPRCECAGHKPYSDILCRAALDATCDELGCNMDETQLITRRRLGRIADLELYQAPTPMLHIGSIASGDIPITSATIRDDVAKATGVVGFEVEGAGIWDKVSCIVVKGVCDYADCHKSENWKRFASATAASASKAILGWYNPKD